MPDDAAQTEPPYDVSKALETRAPDLLAAAAAAVAGAVVVGLIGAGIQRSRTPAMHEREAAALGIRLIYKLIDLSVLALPPEALGDLMAWAERAGFAGLNITYPCKQAAVEFVDTRTDDGQAIGAINTVVFKDGTRLGHNTDCSGFAESFRREGAGFSKGRAVLLGAGGAGSAVAHALLLADVGSLAIHDLDAARAEALADRLCRGFGASRATAVSDVAAAVAAADGLVNATPVGADTHPGIPIDPALLRPEMWVVDVNYFAAETELLAAARTLGCRTIAGKGMAIFQAAHAFELFTGRKPDAARMERHFEAAQRA
jgi:quinate/shikimate dehydrogenase (NAD+)